jgi:hypothetical protein
MINTISTWIEKNQGKWFCITIVFIVVSCSVADSLTLSDEDRGQEEQ